MLIGQILKFFKACHILGVKDEYEQAQERTHFNPQSDDFDMPMRDYST